MTSAGIQAGIADRLGSTLFVAALAHGVVILGITFTTEPLSDAATLPALNVTLLVDSATAERNVPPQDLLADRAQRGAGDLAEGPRPTRALTASHPVAQLGDPSRADLDEASPREPTPAPEQLVTRAKAAAQVDVLPDATEPSTAATLKAAMLIPNTAPPSLAAELDFEAVLPKSDAAVGVARPSTSESVVAAYLVGWRQRVERIGTANFPARLLAPGRHYGRPTLEVAIGPQGNLEEIVVRKSSGDGTLDQAALKILRMAAPFDPLPPSITAEYQVLRFAYEWDFSSGERAFVDGSALTR